MYLLFLKLVPSLQCSDDDNEDSWEYESDCPVICFKLAITITVGRVSRIVFIMMIMN